tara:strand:- start:48 stop:1088 length:1041 start_codon:yes stop_codon:yes gene_type:complete
MKRLLLAPLLISIFTPVFAEKKMSDLDYMKSFEKNWFSNELLGKQFIEVDNFNPNQITPELLDQARIGGCKIYVSDDLFPSEDIKNDCKRLYKEYKNKFKFSSQYKFFALKNDFHEECLKASDYQGCMKFNQGDVVIKKEPKIDKNKKRSFVRDDGNRITFDPKTVLALNKKGDYGRYLKFNYRINFYRGSTYIPKTQITPDRVTTNTYGTINSYGGGGSYSGNSYSTITPGATMGGFTIPGGMRSHVWQVTVDCKEYTADWRGDMQGWRKLKGAKKDTQISTDMAVEIADEYCPQMNRLVAEAKERDRILAIEEIKKAEQRKNNTTGSVKINCDSPVWKNKPRCN